MANNRLYIRCKGCGESIMITKNFGEPYCLDDHEVKMLNQFLTSTLTALISLTNYI